LGFGFRKPISYEPPLPMGNNTRTIKEKPMPSGIRRKLEILGEVRPA